MSTIGLFSRATKHVCRHNCRSFDDARATISNRASLARGLMNSSYAYPPQRTTSSLWRGPQARQCSPGLKLLSSVRRYRTNQTHQTRKEREEQGNQVETEPKAKSSTAETVIHEDIYTIPNFLTLTRLVAAPAVGYLILHDSHMWAVGLFTYAGITDLLDGWIARRWNRKTVVGTIIDPLADKALMTILTVCLATKGALPLWLAAMILGRDVGLGIAAIYYRWISLPPPKTFRRYWDFSLPSAEVRPTTISKYNTFLQLGLVGLTTAAPLIHTDLSLVLTVFQYSVAVTTLCSGASYIFSRDAVKFLK
ncbi:hypothetical protein E4U46_008298 [Claviceps purpurea]|nr:hypothetical protein E4U46_008298 [Claviceps purpurea]